MSFERKKSKDLKFDSHFLLIVTSTLLVYQIRNNSEKFIRIVILTLANQLFKINMRIIHSECLVFLNSGLCLIIITSKSKYDVLSIHRIDRSSHFSKFSLWMYGNKGMFYFLQIKQYHSSSLSSYFPIDSWYYQC